MRFAYLLREAFYLKMMLNFLTRPIVSRFIIAAIFLCAGTLHFIRPGAYVSVMPNYIPWHAAMVYISGAAEILGAIGIIIPKTQKWAGWVLIALLIAVYPANIEMAIEAFQHQGWSLYFWATLLRLPLQFVLIYWIYWACIK